MTIVEKRPSSFLETGDAATFLAERTAYVDQLVTGRSRPARPRLFPAGRRRLWPAAPLPLLRYRPAPAVRIRAPRARQQGRHLAVPAAPLGLRPARQPVRAHARRVPGGPRQQCGAERQPARPAVSRRRSRALRASSPAACRASSRPAASRWSATWPISRANGTPSTRALSIISNPTSRRLPADCAISSFSAGSSNSARAAPPSPRPSCATPSATWRASAATSTWHARRDQNLLTFEAQDAARRTLARRRRGPLDARLSTVTRAPSSAPPRGSSKSTEGAVELVCSRSSATAASASRTPTSASLRDRVHFRAPQQIEHQPELVLNLFEFVARHGVRPSLDAEQQIEPRRAAHPRARAHPMARARPHPLAAARARWPSAGCTRPAS